MLVLFFSFAGILVLNNCVRKQKEKKVEEEVAIQTADTTEKQFNVLTPAEEKEGWQLLFNGKDLTGWKGYNLDTVPDNWSVEEGCLVCLGKGSDLRGDLITVDEFGDFDLKLEWKLSPGGNSGIFYRVVEDPRYKTPYVTGPEYQLIDQLGWKGEKLADWQTTGAAYAVYPPQNPKIKPALEWNTAEIVAKGAHVIHYLNGEKVVEYDLWSDDWKERVKNSKWQNHPEYGQAKKGHIGLQDHGSKIWFRNIKIKEL